MADCNCDCGAEDSSEMWAGVHSKHCATQLIKGMYRLHDMESGTIVKIGDDGIGREFCNTLNSFGDQQANAKFILEAIVALRKAART